MQRHHAVTHAAAERKAGSSSSMGTEATDADGNANDDESESDIDSNSDSDSDTNLAAAEATLVDEHDDVAASSGRNYHVVLTQLQAPVTNNCRLVVVERGCTAQHPTSCETQDDAVSTTEKGSGT